MLSTHIEINQIKERTKLLADAEIKALQAQINPHFLFNALNTISYYCGVQPQTAKNSSTIWLIITVKISPIPIH